MPSCHGSPFQHKDGQAPRKDSPPVSKLNVLFSTVQACHRSKNLGSLSHSQDSLERTFLYKGGQPPHKDLPLVGQLIVLRPGRFRRGGDTGGHAGGGRWAAALGTAAALPLHPRPQLAEPVGILKVIYMGQNLVESSLGKGQMGFQKNGWLPQRELK